MKILTNKQIDAIVSAHQEQNNFINELMNIDLSYNDVLDNISKSDLNHITDYILVINEPTVIIITNFIDLIT
jgi:hypothetical protein